MFVFSILGVSAPAVLVTRPQRGGGSAVSVKFLFVDASCHRVGKTEMSEDTEASRLPREVA